MKTKLEAIATKARNDKQLQFSSLAHHVTTERLRKHLNQISTNTALGIDEQSVAEAKATFSDWSEEMVNSVMKRGYRPLPCRRVYIPKPGKSNETRPIAVPTVKDRVLQKAVSEVLNAIYEEDFLECSFGGRHGRSAHQAIAKVQALITFKRINWIYEADLKDFFGSLSREWIKRFLSERVRDPRITSLIVRWLKAGVMENGQWQATESGTVQGGPISVLISNLYLHYVLDLWIEKVVKERMSGEVYYVRYIDDFVLCFQHHEDAVRFKVAVEKRLNKFSLSIEPNKTRLLSFGRYAKERAARRSERMETFSFLGITFYNTVSRQGWYKVGMKTEKKRLHRSCVKMKELIRRNRHAPIPEQSERINRMLMGHNRYYGVPGNTRSLDNLLEVTRRYWRKMLSSRSQKGKMTWSRYGRLLKRFPLCQPRLSFTYRELKEMAEL